MQWTPEHMQWGERHFELATGARSPLHKAEAFVGHLQQTYHYAWANDDISALTASNLLKKYAERYSGILESPDDRVLLGPYTNAAPGHLNGRKCDGEAWQDGTYPLSCVRAGVAVGKAGMTAATMPAVDVSSGIGGSPGLVSTLTETSFSSSSSTSSCGSHPVGSLHAALVPQAYSMGYSGSFMHSGYSGQATAALTSPHPSPLHSSGLLQPPSSHPPSNVMPSYNAASSCLSGYSYAAADYPPQTAVGPGYSPGGAPPPSAYLPSGLAAPTPLPSSALPGYAYQPHTLGPIAPKPLNSSSASSLKRKAFFMSGQEELNSSYGNFSYSQQCSPESPIYSVPDSGIPNTVRANGFDGDAETTSLAFKSTKQLMSSDQPRKFSGQSSRPPTPVTFSSSRSSLGALQSGDSFDTFASPGTSEHSDDHIHVSRSMAVAGIGSATSSTHPAVEQLKGIDPHLVELINNEIVQQVAPVDWSDIAGLELAKAVLKEELLWPMLRPDMFNELATIPRTVLLFGPKGTGRTLLARCIASQLGASFLRLSGSALVTKLRGEGEKIVYASFLMARSRQPAVVFIHDIDLLISSQLKEDNPVHRTKTELLAQLDNVLASPEDHIVVICSTSQPDQIDESVRRYFMKRLLIPFPCSTARHQIISQLLSQHNFCLSEKEVNMLVQQTEGFSGLNITHLCQEAAVDLLKTAGVGLSAVLPGQLRPITYQDIKNVLCKFQPSKSQTELDTYTEWNRMFGCSQ